MNRDSKSLVNELILERHLEEFRESINDDFRGLIKQPRVREVAARIYIKVVSRWELSSKDAAKFIGTSYHDYQAWLWGDAESLDIVELEKIWCLLGIYRHLGTLYSGHIDRADRWIHFQNFDGLFGGRSPYKVLEGSAPDVFHLVLRYVAALTV